MAVVDYANFVTECLTSDGSPERSDGWLLKHTDTGYQYIHVSGTWLSLALGLSFAPPTKGGRVTTDASGLATVTFGTPFVDDGYAVILTCGDLGGMQPPLAVMVSRSASGFSIKTYYSRTGNSVGNVIVSWLATRDFNA